MAKKTDDSLHKSGDNSDNLMRDSSLETNKNVSTPYPLIIFILSLVFALIIGITFVMGETSDLKPIGAILGATGACIGAVGAFFIIKLIFPHKGAKNLLSYILGGLTILLGIGFFLLLGFLSWGNEIVFHIKFIAYALMGLFWVIIMIKGGIEAPSFPLFVLGGVLGGVLYAIAATLSPNFYKDMDPETFQTQVNNFRIMYGIVGAYTGAMSATMARAGGFLLKTAGSKNLFNNIEL